MIQVMRIYITSFIFIALSISLASCKVMNVLTPDSPKKMFKLQVLDSTDQVSDIHYFKDKSAMHGPMYFRFSVSNPDVIKQKIIEKHKLSKATGIPPLVPVINDNAYGVVDWWKSVEELEDLPAYSISYVPRSGIGDFELRCLFVENNVMYFVTTGFFPLDEYRVEIDENLKPQTEYIQGPIINEEQSR